MTKGPGWDKSGRMKRVTRRHIVHVYKIFKE